MFPRTTGWLLLVVAGAAGGCGGAPTPPIAPPPAQAGPDPCRVNPGGTTSPDTVFIAGPVRLVDQMIFRQRHASPVRLDCEGRLRPGLATSWTADSGGRIWTLALDATADSAGQLAAQWNSAEPSAAALRLAGVNAVEPLDARRMAVVLHEPHDTLPAVFADPVLAVERRGRFPVFRPVPTSDPRDALDRGADFLITDDPSVAEYASANPGLLITPLPWARSYVLVLPHGVAGFDSLVQGDSAGFRTALARDAVPADARAAAAPFWWETRTACGGPSTTTGVASHSGGPAIVYPRGDRIARALAERLVALSTTPRVSVRGLDSTAFAGAFTAGRGQAFVLSLPRVAPVPCRELAGWPMGATVVALVETRSRLVVRRGLPPLEVDWDGGVWMPPAP